MSKEAIEEYWNRGPCNAWWGEKGWNITEHKRDVEPHIWPWSDFPRWKDKKVLVLGCGIGTMTIEFARWAKKVVAVDISGDSILKAKERAIEAGVDSNIWWVCDDIEHLDLLSWQKENDLIYSFGVLHHTPDPLAALRRAWYHAADGAELYIMLYHKWAWKWLEKMALHGHEYGYNWKRLVRGRSEAQEGCPWTTVWTREQAIDLVRQAGFEPYEVRVDHIFPWCGKAYGQGEYRVAFPWSIPLIGGPLYQWAKSHFGQHLLVKARKVG